MELRMEITAGLGAKKLSGLLGRICVETWIVVVQMSTCVEVSVSHVLKTRHCLVSACYPSAAFKKELTCESL